MKYVLTVKGREKVTGFINDCAVKRKNILDAELDTANDTNLPTEADIISDLNYGVGIDNAGDYYNKWGVTDHCNSDSILGLSINEDFVEAE